MADGFGSGVKRFFREWTPVIIAVLLIRSFLVEAFMVPTGSMEDTILVGDFMLVNKFVYGVKIPFTDRTLIPVSSPKRGDIVIFRFPVDPDMPVDSLHPNRYARIFPSWLPLLPLFWDKQTNFFTWYTPRNFVKRCVAVAGDTVEVRNKELFINGKKVVAPYAVHKFYYTLPPLPQELKPDFQHLWENRSFYRSELSPYVRDNFGPVVVPEGHIFAMGDNRDNSEDSRFWGPLPLRYLRGKPLVLYFSSSAAPNIARIIISPWAIRFNRIGRLVR
ncbi:signal peptidase I [candidate division WOR-3 bacterium]|nr:signal peptidase I [candidate division WOR-3 bacterium]